jgi:hypothetical protein
VRLALAFVMVVVASNSGCASASVPPVPMREGALLVRVFTDLADVSPNCMALRVISASDGKVGSPGAFKGTRDRVIQKLQNAAVLVGGDTIAVNEAATLASLAFEGAPGSEIALQATAYRCAALDE